MAVTLGRWGSVIVALLLAQAACAAAPARMADSAEAAVGSSPSGTTLERQLRRTATLALSVRDVESAQKSCAAIVQQAGGYLENSSLSAPSRPRT